MDNGASSYRRFRDEGDESGLAELILAYRDGLIFYINSMVGDIHMAEELAEDTFVLLGTKKPRDKGTGSFKTWLYTIAGNLARNSLKRRLRRREISLDECPELTDAEETLENTYWQEEQKAVLHKAMSKLKPEYRQVLWLYYFEGFSQKEIAAVVKKSVHNVETLMYRARMSLKSQLEQEGFCYEDV